MEVAPPHVRERNVAHSGTRGGGSAAMGSATTIANLKLYRRASGLTLTPAGRFAYLRDRRGTCRQANQTCSISCADGEWHMNERAAYRGAVKNAKRRNIEFIFTFEEWVKWWACVGPYEPSNVMCITCQQNSRDTVANGTSSHGERNGASKLTEKQVIEIFHASGSHEDIAARYGTTWGRVYKIKTGRVWRYITQRLLNEGGQAP